MKIFNQKAMKILFNTYWQKNSWKDDNIISSEDFSLAKNAGYMFDDRKVDHSYILEWVEQSLEKTCLIDVCNSFISSLSNRRLELRSALGSYAVSLHFRRHEFTGSSHCNICGFHKESKLLNLNVLSFERHKWGGVRHDSPEYIAFDLECFSSCEKILPKEKDYEIMRNIIKVISQCDYFAKPRDLDKEISRLFKSNKEERRILLEILAYCGILQPANYPSFFEAFINYNDRVLPPVHKIDWTYPVCWWTGKDGINQKALNYYFPQL
jgi:hypothetical protein